MIQPIKQCCILKRIINFISRNNKLTSYKQDLVPNNLYYSPNIRSKDNILNINKKINNIF